MNIAFGFFFWLWGKDNIGIKFYVPAEVWRILIKKDPSPKRKPKIYKKDGTNGLSK